MNRYNHIGRRNHSHKSLGSKAYGRGSLLRNLYKLITGSNIP